MSEKRYRVDAAIAEGIGYTIVENASLEGRNTFRVPARAHLLIDVRRPEALAELFGYAMLKTQPLLVLGEGSNILFTRDWPGIVLGIAARGINVKEDDGAQALVRVEAGENWNDFVRWSLGRGFRGLENLVLIPGTVGAAPIQNIGAYGAEVREFIATVEAWDRRTGELVCLANADCAFGYRDSIFKRERDRYIVTAVDFLLPRQRELRIDYAGVAEELAAIGAGEPTAPTVAEAIARIRTRKLPNPAVTGNAGSFFKNPVVDASTASSLHRQHPALPSWTVSPGEVKLSAAWLIESCGFKGLQQGHAAVSEQHSLVLVNRGQATGSEILALAERIRESVHERFGVALETEPLVL
ncbi:MAG TPA: UDP-N-acetylmuramate dehydrogenase [Dokdonella sp.]|jgi:UDP-N-acetylmuramate dehydrogenase|nr:UDP-N-acetylmuramate dehydrogenase [Dokdonella sp.]